MMLRFVGFNDSQNTVATVCVCVCVCVCAAVARGLAGDIKSYFASFKWCSVCEC